MPKYQINEGIFDLPEGWVDQTINVFPNSPSSPAEFSVVITRDNPFAGESLKDYFERQIKQLPGSLPGLKILRRGELTVGGKEALDLEYNWIGKGKKMHIRQVSLMIDKTIVNVTATAVAPYFPKYVSQFDEVLASFKFTK
jgi:hypothetical protein